MTKTQNENLELIRRKTLRRSVLFMPGDSLRKITKAAHMDVDTIVMDLEDGVALNRKEEARQIVDKALRTLNFGRSERLIRINAAILARTESAERGLTDLQATIDARPDGYVIPKVETAAQVQRAATYLSQAERERGWPQGAVRLLVVVETAKGIMNLGQIAPATSRLDALMFGAEDLAGNIGAQRTRAGWEIFYARSAVVTAAAAYGLQAIDMVLTDLNDLERLEEECVTARRLGYVGKMAIHPRQVATINRVFSPSADEIARAQRLVAAHAQHQERGIGAFELDGKLVDMPMVRAAEWILEQAGLAGLLD